MTDQTETARRERYATAISKWHRDPMQPLYVQGADAVIAIADAEIHATEDAAAETARRLLDQRQEMAEERFVWQERGDRAEARVRELEAGAAVLSDAERKMLTYALDQAQERIWSEDGFTDEDQAAVTSLRRMADETQQPEAGPDFVTRVLELFSLSHADAYGDLFWRVDDGEVRLFANVSDVFAWGGSDCEDITPDTLPALERAYMDLKAVGGEEFTAELYAARQRGTRPQGAAYPSGTHEAWQKVSALYDACGPERELGLGNPKPAPMHTAAAAQQPKEARP